MADSIAPGERSAIYLSSGLDSALIASLFASTIGTPAVTLTVTSRDAGVDEGGLASLMTDRLRARDLRLRFQDEPVERFMDAVWHAELPPVAPTLGSAWAAAALLRRHQIPVALTGDGADELFGGHEWHRTERLRSSFDRPGARSLWSLVVRRAAGSAGADRAAADFLLDATREDSGRVRARFGGLYPPWLPSWHVLDVHRAELLAPALAGAGCDRAARSPDRPPEGFLSALREDVGDMHPLDAALSLEFETKLPGWNLLFVERGAAAHGVDARSPFLDRDFVEFAAALPAEMKIRFLRDKAILRRAARGHVPEAIRRRPKRTPPRQFAAGLFDGPSLARVRDHVSESSVARAGLFSWPVIARLFDERGRAPAAGFHRFRIDSVLTLVLGVQLLHDRMVRRLDVAPPAERAIQEPTHA